MKMPTTSVRRSKIRGTAPTTTSETYPSHKDRDGDGREREKIAGTHAKSDPAYRRYSAERIGHWNRLAHIKLRSRMWGDHYRARLKQIHRHLVGPGQRVLEIGCGDGALLAATEPSVGIGLDFSSEMIKKGGHKQPQLLLIESDAHSIPLRGKFDVIILSDLVNDLWDIQAVFEEVARLSGPRTRVIINFYSRLWELPLKSAAKAGISKPTLQQNWLQVSDVEGLLNLAGFEVIRGWQEFLWPLPLRMLDSFCNRFLVKIWPFNYLALTNFIVARPMPMLQNSEKDPLVSVIIPTRNEEGNIRAIFSRTPEMGHGSELIFVEGHSKDQTYVAIEKAMARFPHRRCTLLKQSGTGKADAVQLGFKHAIGEIMIILDADLSVAPEDLPRFIEVLRSGKGEFANGVRLVYPMERQAMRFLNLVGNKLFILAFSWLIGQPIKDTLCGTKALWKADYELIEANRTYFGDLDPFGDFDLLFGAVKQNMRIVDVPIRYRERKYGVTNIHRWKHGWLLLKMVFVAAKRLKFV